jgi:perosamine synthetase
MIPLSVPTLQGNEWKYVKECLDTEWVSSAGKYVELFEEKIAEYTGTSYAVACVNGTAALQIALRLAGVMPGHEVIVPTITFIAPVNTVRYNGAEPVFMDADEYYNIDIGKTIEFINNCTRFENGYTINKSTNKRISAIVPVHVFGNAVDLEELVRVCEERNIVIVEDAAESIGTYYTNQKLAKRHTGTIGELGCLSFNGNKIITSGGGGMILTDNSQFAEKARYLTTQAKDDEVRYVHDDIGYNYRLTNIQAALGVAQLEQLPKFLKKKQDIYKKYTDEIAGVEGLKITDTPDYAENNHWMILLQVNEKIYGKDRDSLMKEFKNNGIQTRPVWYLNHLQKPYSKCQSYKIEKAPELLEQSICLPASVDLTETEFNTIIHFLKKSKTLGT